MAFILALDQGTTSSRAILFDQDGTIRGVAQAEFPQIFPRAGWVEHDPQQIWNSQLEVTRKVLVERSTGKPIHNAIVWQDRRTSEFCDELKRAGHSDLIRSKTGLVIDAYFSGSKLRWILDNVPGARERAKRGELAFGTVDTWLLWNLTGGALHVTDVTNASRTMLYNLNTGDWDDELLRLLNVPREVQPKICSSSEVYGETKKDIFGASIHIAGIAGDQQAALFGQNCFERGQAKNTYGTGCFMLMNIGEKPTASKHQLITTVAWKTNGQTEFAFEGSVFIGGAVVQWLRDGLGIVKSAAEIEALAASVPDCGGVYFVPAFAGLGAPHWDQYARGSITGITRGTTKGHIARAALEAMRQDAGIEIDQLRVDGGASANNLLMQFQADILQVPVARPIVTETTALGAAYLAGLAVGFWKDRNAVKVSWKADRVFKPGKSADEVAHRRSRWTEAIKRAHEWEEHTKYKES